MKLFQVLWAKDLEKEQTLKKKSESCDTLKQKIGCRLYFIKFIL